MRSQMPPACRAKRRRESFEASVPFAQTYLVEPLDGRHGVCLAVRLDVRRRGLRLPEQLLEHGALSIKQGQNSLLSPHLSPPFPEKPKKKKEQGSASPRSPRSSSQFFSSHQGPVQDSLPPLWCASRPSPREEGHLARLDGLQLRSALLLLVSFSSEWRRGRQGTIRGFWELIFFFAILAIRKQSINFGWKKNMKRRTARPKVRPWSQEERRTAPRTAPRTGELEGQGP